MVPSTFQQAIYDFIQHGTGSCVVEAVAGSGKTTTIVEAAKLLPQDLQIAFVAFNKGIATELANRLPANVASCTLNSMGHRAWSRATGNKRLELDSTKVQSICWDIIANYERKTYSQAVKQLVALAKAHGLVPKKCAKGKAVLTHDTEQNWLSLADKYAVEPEGMGSMDRLIEICRLVLRRDIECSGEVIDFDDQLYLPVIHLCNFNKFDVLFVDEAQDINLIQRAMLRLSLREGGRLIAVGDSRQAIYGFRGADTDSIQHIREEFSAITLPLSISYRCPQAVVRHAQNFVSHILPHPEAPEGKVETIANYDQTLFDAADGIICRNSAPLVDLAYKLIRNGRGCRILGREIGQGLIKLIRKIDALTVDELQDSLAEYLVRESEKMMAKGQEDKAGGLHDKIETIMVMIHELSEKGRDIDTLCANIERLFNDQSSGLLTLSTIHKAKGLEYHRVFILDAHLMPSKWARQAWQQGQECNLQYVATTRAKMELYFITVEGFKEAGTQPASTLPVKETTSETAETVTSSAADCQKQ